MTVSMYRMTSTEAEDIINYVNFEHMTSPCEFIPIALKSQVAPPEVYFPLFFF